MQIIKISTFVSLSWMIAMYNVAFLVSFVHFLVIICIEEIIFGR